MIADGRVMSRSMFETLSPEQQQQYYLDNGFILLPGVVSGEQIERIAAEVSGSPRYDLIESWHGPGLESLLANPQLLQPMRRCYGEDLRMFKAVYEEWRDPDEKKKEVGRQRGDVPLPDHARRRRHAVGAASPQLLLFLPAGLGGAAGCGARMAVTSRRPGLC